MSAAKKLESLELTQESPDWNRRVLVVDDEKDIAKSYEDILNPGITSGKKLASSRSKAKSTEGNAKKEFDVVIVNTAGEALKLVKDSIKQGNPFAMGFFDVMLNDEIDGIELVKRITEIDPSMYAVFVTAYNDRSVDSIKELLGQERTVLWDYLNKPFSGGEILQKARNYCSLWNLRTEKEIRETQLAQTQNQLMESERANAVAAISRGVTHEFGNILMQIMGKADIARSKKEDEMKKALEVILDASQRASEILNRFKTLSNTGGEKAPKEMVALDEVLNRAIDLMEYQIRESNVKVIRTHTDKVNVLVNTTSLLQVILNVSINAIHAMGNSGQIDFEVNETSEWGEIKIRDYGPGIKEDLLEKVLQPFFTTKGDKGTGLGMSISREIVQVEHEGEFEVFNHPMKGLVVILRFPKTGGQK